MQVFEHKYLGSVRLQCSNALMLCQPVIANLCFSGGLCGHKELHLSVLAPRNGQGAVGLQVEMLLASHVNLPCGAPDTISYSIVRSYCNPCGHVMYKDQCTHDVTAAAVCFVFQSIDNSQHHITCFSCRDVFMTKLNRASTDMLSNEVQSKVLFLGRYLSKDTA